jgi:hypothetical protein
LENLWKSYKEKEKQKRIKERRKKREKDLAGAAQSGPTAWPI